MCDAARFPRVNAVYESGSIGPWPSTVQTGAPTASHLADVRAV